MLLSVITPDNQPGMQRMLKKELEGIDAEVLVKEWGEGLLEATGDYTCLLEKDSAIQQGTILDNLQIFLDKPAYRKLAMVSPMVDIPQAKNNISFTYDEGLSAIIKQTSDEYHATRVGYVPGAIIRTSSLRKAIVSLDHHPTLLSCMLSLFFWESGLRIALNPKSLYYVPENASYAYLSGGILLPLMPSSKVVQTWEHEMIS